MLRQIKSVVSCQLSVVRKEILLCILSAVLLISSFPKFNLWILAWFAFIPLFFALEGKSKCKAFLLSYLTGVIFWFGIIYWLVHVTLLGTILLILYLALYFGFFGLIISAIGYRLSTINLVFIPSIWIILEHVRSHLFTGFGWTLLGYSQYLNLPVIQIADITGAWGVSFFVMMVNVFLYKVVRIAYCLPGRQAGVLRKKDKIAFTVTECLLFFVLCFLVLSYGFYKLRMRQGAGGMRLKVSVIQGNIPQEFKWEPLRQDFIIDKYMSLTKQAARENPDLIIWPEASVPVVLEEKPEFYKKIKNFAKEIKIPILLGAVTTRDNFYYNSALLISAKGEPLNRYDKLHLVPFGEYIPLRKSLGFLETIVPIGDISPGKEYTVFELTGASMRRLNIFSVLICFEDLFPGLSREFVKNGAHFLINITNDAWFKKTSSPYQHLQASVFRAVENRASLVRGANTGVSAFIGPSGKIISLVQDELGRDIFINGYHAEEIAISKDNLTFYTRYGDIFVLLCVIFALAVIIKFYYFR